MPSRDMCRKRDTRSADDDLIEEIISLIRAEESRRSVMLEPQTMDGSALAMKANHEKEKSYQSQHFGRDSQWKENKDNLWCTHYKKLRHIKEMCW